MKKYNRKKTAQEIQDDIFRRMSADKKIALGTQLWKLARAIVGNKINYAKNRSISPASRDR